MLLVGVFAARGIDAAGANGLASGGGLALLGLQALGVVSCAAYSFGATWVLAKVVDRIVGLRVSVAAEIEGLDMSQHSERAYTGLGSAHLGSN